MINSFSNSDMLSLAYMGLGTAYIGNGNQMKAIESFWVITQKYPRSAVASRSLIELGSIYYAREDYQQAESVFNRVISEYKQSDELFKGYLELAKSQEALRKYDEAKRNYNQVIIQFSSDIIADRARVNLGKIFLEEGAGDQSLDLFKMVISRRTDELAAEAKYFIGIVYKNKEDYQSAYEHLRGVTYIYPRYDTWATRGLLEAGFCLEKRNMLIDAQKIYEEVLAKHPNDNFGVRAREALARIRR